MIHVPVYLCIYGMDNVLLLAHGYEQNKHGCVRTVADPSIFVKGSNLPKKIDKPKKKYKEKKKKKTETLEGGDFCIYSVFVWSKSNLSNGL